MQEVLRLLVQRECARTEDFRDAGHSVEEGARATFAGETRGTVARGRAEDVLVIQDRDDCGRVVGHRQEFAAGERLGDPRSAEHLGTLVGSWEHERAHGYHGGRIA